MDYRPRRGNGHIGPPFRTRFRIRGFLCQGQGVRHQMYAPRVVHCRPHQSRQDQ